MTRNQIDYQKSLETARANRASEQLGRDQLVETNRSNLRNEALKHEANIETNRSNLAREAETHRSNVANESETQRSNLVRERETNRSNLANELIKSATLAEQSRHNVSQENIDSTRNMLNYDASKYATDVNAKTATRTANINNATKLYSDERNRKLTMFENLNPLQIGGNVTRLGQSLINLLKD